MVHAEVCWSLQQRLAGYPAHLRVLQNWQMPVIDPTLMLSRVVKLMPGVVTESQGKTKKRYLDSKALNVAVEVSSVSGLTCVRAVECFSCPQPGSGGSIPSLLNRPMEQYLSSPSSCCCSSIPGLMGMSALKCFSCPRLGSGGSICSISNRPGLTGAPAVLTLRLFLKKIFLSLFFHLSSLILFSQIFFPSFLSLSLSLSYSYSLPFFFPLLSCFLPIIIQDRTCLNQRLLSNIHAIDFGIKQLSRRLTLYSKGASCLLQFSQFLHLFLLSSIILCIL
ncbi:unnamed protein product [Acanthosepion pharaonis]|uniref:Uncharacterized protein n=1 Tax=Acanthosepion pharaonis TaxID=158019 RepID=A0A812BNT6_ACAPH|nr:unnamed protein product [Sepia pharaonis]